MHRLPCKRQVFIESMWTGGVSLKYSDGYTTTTGCFLGHAAAGGVSCCMSHIGRR